MPSTRAERLRTRIRASAPWRKAMPNRTVRRQVQGVELFLPWSHRLPDYARSRPTYGQNLIMLAERLSAGRTADNPLPVLDVGANVGDSAAQIMARCPARVLCVEGDPYWVRYLQLNLGDKAAVAVEEVLLVPATDRDRDVAVAPVRVGGTTTFVPAAVEAGTMPRMSVAALRERHPDFDGLRLVKSDTDGHDPTLVPAIAAAWAASTPVLFFEFDPIMARAAGDGDPNDVWARLAELGYDEVGVWDNGGDPLGRMPIAEAADAATSLEPRPVHLGYYFWDVAVCHREDAVGHEALAALLPERYDVRGILR